MDFEPFDYMAWAKRHQGSVPFDLSASGMPPPPSALFPLDPAWLTVSGASAELRHALKVRIAETYGVGPERVLLAAGTSEANFLVCASLLVPGDRVLVERPAYQALARLPRLFGAEVDRFDRREGASWSVDLDRLVRGWTAGTKLVVLTTPHNPTGAVVDGATLRELGDWLERRDAFALVDEVYRDFLPDPSPVAQVLHPRLISTASLTKVYGLSGLRAGWALAPAAVVERCEQIYDFMAVNPPRIPLHAAIAAFDRRAELLARARETAAANRPRVAAFLRETPALKGALPEAGIIASLRLPRGMDASAFAERLRLEHDTLVAPGDFFDLPGFVRIAYGMSGDVLDAGLVRVRSLVQSSGSKP
jgi:aspartate/methionine/tyrosine aminotransferase